jgi:bZIP-type transcription factor MBZ1
VSLMTGVHPPRSTRRCLRRRNASFETRSVREISASAGKVRIGARNIRANSDKSKLSEYITTLEADVAERDRLIDVIRGELGSTKSENYALKQEIEILKKSLLQANPAPVLPPPAPLPAVSAAATVAARNSASSPTPSSPLLTPNPNKDLPSSPRVVGGRSGFWGGGSGPFGTVGGFTPVHTTLVPELSLSTLAGKGLLTPSKPLLQENLNPALNGQKKPTVTPHSKATGLHPHSQFDSFTDLNPFTMKSMDLYRMNLWSNVGTQKQLQHHNQLHQTPQLNGLAAAMLPHHFAASTTKPTTSLVVSSKAPNHPTSSYTPDHSPKATPQEAMLASLASQTLLAKLGSAFWEAFSGQSPRKGVDADKVRRVLEGKAVVKVVDVDEPPLQPKPKRAVTTTSITASPKVPQKPVDLKSCQTCVTELLEESMRSLSISKRGPL